jgi:hypothetical protein
VEKFGIKKYKKLLRAIFVNIPKIYNYTIFIIAVVVDADTTFADFVLCKTVILHICRIKYNYKLTLVY